MYRVSYIYTFLRDCDIVDIPACYMIYIIFYYTDKCSYGTLRPIYRRYYAYVSIILCPNRLCIHYFIYSHFNKMIKYVNCNRGVHKKLILRGFAFNLLI